MSAKVLRIVIPIIFGALAVVAVLIFSFGSRGGDGIVNNVDVILWGSLPEEGVKALVTALKDTEEKSVIYREINENRLENELVEALAEGRGPDMVILPHDMYIAQKNKLYALSYELYPVEQYINTFARSGEIFLASDGIYGFPLAIDPLVMYWNKDLFANEGLVTPPRNWEQFFDFANKLTKVDENQNITQSFVALGEGRNVTHMKEILSAMMMQTGETFVVEDPRGYDVVLGDVGEADSVLSFYTNFSNPRLNVYSWNSALPQSINAFASGDLAVYFGFASDLPRIQALNPLIDIGVANFPQLELSQNKSTYGRLYSIVLLKNSPNLQQAYDASYQLTHDFYAGEVANVIGLAPARLDLLSLQPLDENFPIFYQAAVQSRVWLDPDRDETRTIFNRMVSSVTVGREDPTTAIQDARKLLDEIIRNI